MNLTLESGKPKGYWTKSRSRWIQTSYSIGVVECGSLCEIGTNVNVMILLEERPEAPKTLFLNIDGNIKDTPR